MKKKKYKEYKLEACKFMVQHLPSKCSPVNVVIISSKNAENILIKVFSSSFFFFKEFDTLFSQLERVTIYR